MADHITINGANIHNLKSVDVTIPKQALTVITGVSGSGKSSLAFDTLYEEGKRRYLMFSDTSFIVDDHASSFESITGLSPTVAVEQRIIRQSNPRSTVGTRTKISAMLAVLMAHDGAQTPEYVGQQLEMAMFQKNSPKGMCVRCLGSGEQYYVDEDELFGDMTRSVANLFNSYVGEAEKGTHFIGRLKWFCKQNDISPDQPLNTLTEAQLNNLKYGVGSKVPFDGVIPWLINAYRWSVGKNNWISKVTCVHRRPCPRCGGTGLGDAANRTTLNGKTVTQLEALYIKDLAAFLKTVDAINKRLVSEIITKLNCMADVGLHHLSLSRPVPTLSGGEIQRLFLASYIIAEMDSIVFIFDEPTIGLHEVEKGKLLDIIRNLINRGNTVVAVEHDPNFMRAADYIIDLGPHAGEYGGERIFQGSYESFISCECSLTSPYLSGTKSLPVKNAYKPVDKTKTLRISGASIHNLRGISVEIPLGLMVGVAGVSGSGKSSLVADSLVPVLKRLLKSKLVYEDGTQFDAAYDSGGNNGALASDNSDGYSEAPGFANGGGHDGALASDTRSPISLSGVEQIKKCVVVDQKPIGRSRTSCPATYTGIMDRVRAMFAKESGLPPGMFTVNSKGRCPNCKGHGVISYHVGMGNFIHSDCSDCGGTGYVPEALDVKLDGMSIRDILDMSVSRALAYFDGKDKVVSKMLETLQRVGMGYIKLGQKTPTISGGEAQRIKLAAELGKTGTVKGHLYILDEPTTGLSFSDTEQLLNLMQELTDKGATVIVTEHDPGLLSYCDYLIELGPGGGSDGGYVITTGTPAELKGDKNSIIGKYLAIH